MGPGAIEKLDSWLKRYGSVCDDEEKRDTVKTELARLQKKLANEGKSLAQEKTSLSLPKGDDAKHVAVQPEVGARGRKPVDRDRGKAGGKNHEAFGGHDSLSIVGHRISK